MFKKMFIVLVTVFFFVPSLIQAGSFGKGDPSGVPGQWYVGTTPSYVAPEKHPILFVHGFNSSSGTWWDGNNMYDTALQNGYETAFIDLYPTKNMWDNGSLLAEKIRDIYNFFGEKVVVVAHSKGGVDTQSALVHYNAYPYVERVITLSSPHHGSQLANLAYSSWAGWLAAILGSRNDATYSLQTGYMSNFRSQTDDHANIGKVPFYTFGGTKWGSFGSSLYWGGLYLSMYGSNDGVVTTTSSRLPNSTQIRIGDWNHTTIKEGSSTFNLFRNYLNENAPAGAGIQSQNAEAISVPADLPSSFVRGGEYIGKHQQSIYVEDGVNQITIDWMSDQKKTDLKLTDPSGKEYTAFTVENDENAIFQGAYHHSISISQPAAGEWKLEANSEQQEHYLLNVTFDSPLQNSLSIDLDGSKVKLFSKDSKLQVKSDMTIEYYKNGKLKQGNIKVKNSGLSTYQLPKLGEGVYNITINLEGKQNNNNKFQRTIIKSVYVDQNGRAFYQ
ncbi:hypothetical protein J9303_07215 [Bacillaceae bacterium Marseille-Q3522]|nr:hypothetical protein [Bacillaceae bacterium Marseille-Q3522]